MIDNYGLYEKHEVKCLSKPHIVDCEGADIYEGDRFVRINGEIYSWDTLERLSEFYEQEE